MFVQPSVTIDQHHQGEMFSSVDQGVRHEDEETDWNYYQKDAVTRRQTWRTRKFASFDSKGWDQAKQTISKGGDISRSFQKIIEYLEEIACPDVLMSKLVSNF